MKYIKRGILVIFTLIMLSILVYAVPGPGTFLITNEADCDDNHTILRLSGSTNAHGSLYNASPYIKKLCYNMSDTSVNASSHDCSADNLLLKLSGITNAHGQAPQFSGGYSTNVCYSNINCTGNSGDCPANSVCILRLSGSTNAHISDCSSSYGVRICCTINEPIEEGSLPPVPGEAPPIPGGGGPCTQDSNCTGGQICISGNCTVPTPCISSLDCSSLGEDYSCYTNGGSPICRPAGTGDEDLDGVPDNIDLCVGSDLDDCTLPGGGMSCGSVSGRICSGSCGPSATLSNISREANCWVPSTCTCQGAPVYALGTSVRFDRQCQPGNNCLSRVTIVNADGSGEVDVSLFSSMGLTQNSNPFTETDASCCGISLDEQTGEGRAVPWYGSIALIITSLILVLYYTKRKTSR